jgi:hypothetical protein
MHKIIKFSTGLTARILDFSFAGYGLMCDTAFLKIIFRYLGFPFIFGRNLIRKFWEGSGFRDIYAHIAEKIAGLKNFQENEEWYFRGR